MSTRFPLVPVPCGHCRAMRLPGGVRHQPFCPADGDNQAFYSHPDLMDLEAHLAAFYPEP